ncbi:MAG: hypothetical protein NVS2B16_34510 [Chloroflexota bacterium]
MESAFEEAHVLPVPQAVVDGGDAEWAVLSEAVMRRLADMAEGDVLEIGSSERRNRADVPAWCYLTGHDLLQMRIEGEIARFWIRKQQVQVRKEGTRR